MSGAPVVVGVVCPQCGGPIIYNGNYYCQNQDREDEWCDWAMGEWMTAFNHKVITAYLGQLRREALARGDAAEAERMLTHIAQMRDGQR